MRSECKTTLVEFCSIPMGFVTKRSKSVLFCMPLCSIRFQSEMCFLNLDSIQHGERPLLYKLVVHFGSFCIF